MPKSKIFCLGLSKNGTTSTGKLFQDLKYNVCPIGPGNNVSNENQIYEFCDSVVDKYDFFQDVPWPKVYRKYKNQYPDSRFILTYRPIAKWLNSMGIYGKSIPIHEFVYGNPVYKGNELF